jgi:hypothetical protein
MNSKIKVSLVSCIHRTKTICGGNISEMVVPVSPFPHEVKGSGVFVVDDPNEDESV